MRIKQAPRAKKAKRAKNAKKKSTIQFTRTVAMGIAGIAGIVFVAAAAMTSARTPQPSPSGRTSAARSDAQLPVEYSADATPIEAPRAAAEAAGNQSSPVTIVGCVQHDEAGFRLVDTAGDSAPRARSWKSGFLKRRSAPVDLVGSPSKVRLPSYVGQRVSVTGTLDNRELQIQSLRRVAPSCTN
jgi:hypothetical protein